MSIFVKNLVQIEPNNINLMKEQVCKCNQSTCLKRAKDTMTMSRKLTQISIQLNYSVFYYQDTVKNCIAR